MTRRGRRGQGRSRRQRELRRQRGERAFLFDKDLSFALGDVDREPWEIAIRGCGGDVEAAARWCGLDNVPRAAKALWGRSAEDALVNYHRWQGKRRGR